jgi:hypothetical protein
MSNCVGSSGYGFQPRRGREPTPIAPHYAPFPTYKPAAMAALAALQAVGAEARRCTRMTLPISWG